MASLLPASLHKFPVFSMAFSGSTENPIDPEAATGALKMNSEKQELVKMANKTERSSVFEAQLKIQALVDYTSVLERRVEYYKEGFDEVCSQRDELQRVVEQLQKDLASQPPPPPPRDVKDQTTPQVLSNACSDSLVLAASQKERASWLPCNWQSTDKTRKYLHLAENAFEVGKHQQALMECDKVLSKVLPHFARIDAKLLKAVILRDVARTSTNSGILEKAEKFCREALETAKSYDRTHFDPTDNGKTPDPPTRRTPTNSAFKLGPLSELYHARGKAWFHLAMCLADREKYKEARWAIGFAKDLAGHQDKVEIWRLFLVGKLNPYLPTAADPREAEKEEADGGEKIEEMTEKSEEESEDSFEVVERDDAA